MKIPTTFRNIGLNLFSQGAPMLAALVAIPILIGSLGAERFGCLALAWMMLGYLGLLDLGIGRALTREAARLTGRQRSAELSRLGWTALILTGGLSLILTAVFLIIALWATGGSVAVPVGLRAEIRDAVWPIAGAMPFVMLSGGLRGLLEAQGRFGVLAAVRVPAALYSYLGPVAALAWTHRLPDLLGVLALGRVLNAIVLLALAYRMLHRPKQRFHSATARSLLRQGGWMTVSSIITPLTMQMDRLVIGAVVSLSAVTYYTTPYEMLLRLSIIPAGVMGVLFPAMSRALVGDSEQVRVLHRRTTIGIGLALGLPTLFVVVFAPWALSLWLGDVFSAQSAGTARILAVGLLLHGLLQPSFHLIQAAGRSAWTAALHLGELAYYGPLLWFMVHRFGIEGAATAWLIRMVVSFLILNRLALVLLRPRPDLNPITPTRELACTSLS